MAQGILEGNLRITNIVKQKMTSRIVNILKKKGVNQAAYQQKIEDLFQEAILVYLNAVQSNTYMEQGKFLAYLTSIANNSELNNYKAHQKAGDDAIGVQGNSKETYDRVSTAKFSFFDIFQQEPPEIHELLDLESSSTEQQILWRSILKNAQLLKPRYFQVFQLLLDGSSLSEIAENMQVNYGTAKTLKSRTIKRLGELCNR